MSPNPKTISLALQGGGAHGAFTWGVLDRLLEEDGLVIDGISGASAGAMNAVMLAEGWREDGRDGARRKLAAFWTTVAAQLSFDPPGGDGLISKILTNSAPGSRLVSTLLGLLRFLSPYQVNPFDVNPLRDILREMVDFAALRAACPVHLFISSTQVRTGKLRLFTETELDEERLLASACLPTLHHSIEIDGEYYWDGGFSGNPAVFPLVFDCTSNDILIVMLHPLCWPDHPESNNAIWERITELGFSATFLREMRAIAYTMQEVDKDIFPLGRIERRFSNLYIHLIEADDLMSRLDRESRYDTRTSFLEMLRDEGRGHADRWLEEHRKSLGVRSTANLAELFC